ncbi:MAG: hypothetical protein LBG87_07070 [Spirochaetaceae bacterium]|jgi:hypothetical protein|nr:hypothetical protein [Spirochaetaceae bacterium]
MSVRATNSLIAEVVIATGIPNSPKMIVQDIDVDKKTVTAVWFSDAREAQQAVFPASALDRAPEEPKKAARAPAVKSARKR